MSASSELMNTNPITNIGTYAMSMQNVKIQNIRMVLPRISFQEFIRPSGCSRALAGITGQIRSETVTITNRTRSTVGITTSGLFD